MGRAAKRATGRNAGAGSGSRAPAPDRGKSAAAVKAEKVTLPNGIATEDAFRLIAASVLRHISSNEAAVRGRNPDGVHQMRIGLRRMRAAVSIFSTLLRDDDTPRLKRELRWLAGRLAPARDLHLLAQRLRRSRAPDPERSRRLADVERRRTAAFDDAQRTLRSARYRGLLRDLAQWIEAGAWSAALTLQGHERDAADFATTVLAKRARKVMRRATDLPSLDVETRHRLRIAAKKLYYATGFFETLIEGRKRRDRLADFQIKLKDLLDDLGALNDLAVQQRLTGELATGRTRVAAPVAPSMSEKAKLARLLAQAVRAGEQLAAAKRFWN